MIAVVVMMVSLLFADPGVTKENVLEWLANSTGFEQNLGQVSDFDGNPVNDVYTRLNLGEFSIFLTEKGASFVIYKSENSDENQSSPSNPSPPATRSPLPMNYARFDLELLNSEIRKENIVYEDELPGYTNHYYPFCPDGILFVKSYRKLRIKEIYPEIDWAFRIEDGRLHHEFEILPSANYEDIKLKVKWADLIVAEDGKRIRFKTPPGEIVDGELFAYEENNPPGIQASYRKIADDIIGFEIKDFSGKGRLIIDPPLSLL